MFDHDPVLEAARFEREAIRRIEERMARQQLGEAYDEAFRATQRGSAQERLEARGLGYAPEGHRVRS